MKYLPEERAKEIAEYIIRTCCTVREAGKYFSLSKSTVHSDITVRLRRVDADLYGKVRDVLEVNKKERHIRGGQATREKFAMMSSIKRDE